MRRETLADRECSSSLAYAIAIGIALPLVYVLSWAPLVSVSWHFGRVAEVTEAIYAPVSQLRENSPLGIALDQYWRLFRRLRPRLIIPDGSYPYNHWPRRAELESLDLESVD